jgi:uncharacterized membrane protein YjjP (DUF1212 family)
MKLWLKQAIHQSAWAPLLVLLFYAIAAKGFKAYLLFPWLDMPTHFLGGAAITYFFLCAINHGQALVGEIPALVRKLLALGLTAITAIAWEFLEFLSDVALGTKMNLGVADTLADLFFGLLGGVVVIALQRADAARPA